MKTINRALLILLSVATLVGCSSLPAKKTETTSSASSAAAPVAVEPKAEEVIKQPQYATVWDRMRAGYALPQVDDKLVTNPLRWYANNQGYLNRVANQAEPYLHYVVTELQAAGLPTELALLPVVESSYDPSVNSPSRAAGIWQIVPETGRNFGLKQNSWYDGRRDVIASTDAAIRLLKRLYTMFDNDWLLATAAYNAGEGTVRRAIDTNKRLGKRTDFWSLPLSQQTQSYVPQLVALSKIVADPQRYALALKPIPDNPYFVKINVDSQINIAQIAKNADMDVEQLKRMNSGFSGWLTDPTEARPLLVPVADAAAFTEQLDALPKLPATKWQEHVVKKNDNLATIAKQYGVSADTIASVNNVKPTGLHAGQRLQIPLSSTPKDPVIAEAEKTIADNKAQRDPNAKNYYTVKSGENLWIIAKAQKMSVNNLAQLNELKPTSSLQPGQKLLVLSQATPEEIAAPHKIVYTIKPGDTLTKIASRFNVSTKDILAWNSVKDESYIHPNQELVIMVPPKG